MIALPRDLARRKRDAAAAPAPVSERPSIPPS
jgi:hypothetical protein